MKTLCFSGRTSNKRDGYALLLSLLIAVFIGMILYLKFMYGPTYEVGSGESDIDPPWRQWHNMQGRIYRNEIGSPAECQPQITKPLEVLAKCEQDGGKRGQIYVAILADGTVQGEWKGAFFIDQYVDFQVITSEFEGLVDPQPVFKKGEEGEDPTKLFFITKGHFSILETNSKSGKVRNLTGEAYARGWIDVNYMVDGELIITTDNKNFFRYTWQGEATEADPSLLELDK